MKVEFEPFGQGAVIKLVGELDHHSAGAVREKIDKVIDRTNTRNIVVDCSEMHFMDSAGLGVMMGRYKKLKLIGGKVVIVNVNETIDRIFSLSGIYRVIPKAENMDNALMSVGGNN